MHWQKRGLVYGPPGDHAWARHSALQPTPLVRASHGTIRVFVGFRDDTGISRVGFVDVDAGDPSRVRRVSEQPVLDIGTPGAFDDNGVVPCAISERPDGLYLFYAGYQLGHRVRFLVFSGLAISHDGGESFARYSRAPVCDRTSDERCFRVIHTIMRDGNRWRAWYGAGNEFLVQNGHSYPSYNIRHAESPDGVHLASRYDICVDVGGHEYRVGRPYVIKHEGLYRMFYAAGTVADGYRLAYAESANGVEWVRKDREIGLTTSEAGWDSRMQAYPAVVTTAEGTYMFYNGNDYGRDGFGYAVLNSW